MEEREDIEEFHLEDDFDPLEDAGVPDDDDEVVDYDYQAPIPDADKSVVPEPVELPASERIEHLLKGIPGQTFRILALVDLCRDEPLPVSELAEELEHDYPQGGSVYDAGRLVQLLERAGAIECVNPDVREAQVDLEEEESEGAVPVDGDQVAVEDLAVDAGDLETVPVDAELTAEPELFAATAAGLEAVDAHAGTAPIVAVITEEDVYLPIYERIFRMVDVDGGCAVADLNKAVDSDPLLQEPRRYCTYFLGRLERCGAARWNGTWKLTENGKTSFDSVFAGKEGNGDD